MYSIKTKNTILLRFLLPYTILLLIPIIMGAVIYSKTVAMVEADVKKSNISMMTQSMDIVDRHLQEIDSTVKRLALNQRILTFINMKNLEEGSPELYKVIDAMEDLSGYRFTNSLVKEVYVYSRETGIVLSTANAQTRMNLAYGRYFKFGDLNYEQWNETTKLYHANEFIPATPVLINEKEYSIITNIQSLPMGAPMYNRGAILVLIDAKAINKLLSQVNIGKSGWAYIEGKKGEIITSISETDRIIEPVGIDSTEKSGLFKCKVDGKDMVATYVKSPSNGWKYVALLPTSFIMAKVNYIKTIIIMATFICVALGLALALFLSYKNSKPIKDIFDMLEGLFGHNNECKNQYIYMKGSITKLIDNNCDLQCKLDDQLPILRTELFMRLLRGSFRDADEINTNFSRLGIGLLGLRYSVMIIKIRGYGNIINRSILKELDVTRLVVNGMVRNKFGESTITSDLDEKHIAVLLSFNSDDQDNILKEVEQQTDEIRNELFNKHNIRAVTAIGGICKSIDDIGNCFTQAQQALEYRFTEGDNKLLWYHQSNENNCGYTYSIEVETTLMNLIKAGDGNKVEKLLKTIYEDNFIKRKLPSNIVYQLIYQMKGTVLRIVDSIPDMGCSEHILNKLSESDSLEGVFSSISKVCMEMCECVNQKKDDRNEVLKRKILDYIETEYMNEELTAYCVATHFSITESYFYHFFKDNLGMTFADYIEKTRIDHANKLLKETDLPVKDIAVKVGYSSVHSFRRAFKRCEGKIPSEIRGV